MRSSKTVIIAHQAMLCRQLALLIASGRTPAEAIKAIAAEPGVFPVKDVVAAMADELDRGGAAEEVLGRHLSVLRGLPSEIFRLGSEPLARAFRDISVFAEKKQELRRTFLASTMYPAVIVAVLTIIVLLLSVIVIPMFATMFADMGSNLPLPTRMVITAAEFLRGGGGMVLVLAVTGIVAGFLRNNRRLFGMLDRIPVLGALSRSIATTEYLKTVTLLVRSGLPLRSALDAAAGSVSNAFYSGRLKDLSARNSDTSGLLDALQRNRIVPAIVGLTLRTGERSGAALPAFTDAAEYLERETELAYGRFSSLLPPLMMITIGVFVGFVIIAMYMPIFQMGSLAS